MLISVIMRCRNRLEYTTRTLVGAIDRACNPERLEFVVIDNASSDGTREWFRWMSSKEWFNKRVRYYRSETNHGDWGGMVRAASLIRGDRVMQLDNDILVPDGWDNRMIESLVDTSRIVCLRRTGVNTPLPGDGMSENGTRTVRFATACWIGDAQPFRETAMAYKVCDDYTAANGPVLELGTTCEHLDGPAKPGDFYRQTFKYPKE